MDNLEVKSYNATKYLSPSKTGLRGTSLADLNKILCEHDTCSLTVEMCDTVVVGANALQNRKAYIKINVVAPMIR